MTNFKRIRVLLGLTQAAIGAELGVTQGNVSFYEKGQTVPPDVARRLIELARVRGHEITFDDVYSDAGAKPDPDRPLGPVSKLAAA